MKHRGTQLLLTGMGFFVFAAGMTLVNVLFLPFARTLYGYGFAPVMLICALTAALMLLLGRALGRLQEERLERIMRIVRPAFLLAMLVIHLIMGYLMEYTPSGDNFMLYTSSQMLASDGNFDAYPDFYLYLSRFSNQWGFMLLLSAFYKALSLLGVTATFYPLALVQALLYTAGLRAALRLARRLRGVRGEITMTAALCLCLPLYTAAAVLYTDTFSMPFVMLTLCAAYDVLHADSGKKQLFAALRCALYALVGGQIKMTVAIALIAAIIVWFIRLRPVRALLCCGLCMLVMALGGAGVEHIMLTRVLDPDMVAQHNTPYIHWIMMSIPTSKNPYGGFSQDYAITWDMMEKGAAREEVMDSIYTRIIDRVYTLRYPNRLALAALRKNANFMGDGTYGMTEMLDDGPVRENFVSSFVLEGRKHHMLFRTVTTGISMGFLLLALLGCIRDIRCKNARAAMGYIAMFGMMLFLMLWEARGRYLFSFVPVMLLLGSGFAAEAGRARIHVRTASR